MQVVGWPLPASLVERIDSMRSLVAMLRSAGVEAMLVRDTVNL
jgi:phosphoribosylcarboxyaminoimidazole (NCAIR) mutase